MEKAKGLWLSFTDFISRNQLLTGTDNVLLAVSGGIDSMVLANLFLKTDNTIGIAHCNFQLRGTESDNDEKFVREFAKNSNTLFYAKSFDTEKYAEEKKVSIQMAARDLRYEWFEKIRVTEGFDYIALAHNKNDILETVLLNIARGTGLKGMTGIKKKSGYIIRPLLSATRNEIVQYADDNDLSYREDSSNVKIKYKRNMIRHQIIPEFEELNPDFIDSFSQTINQIEEAYEIFENMVKKKKEQMVTEIGDKTLIDIYKLRNLSNKTTYLYEFLRPYHFPSQVIPDIIESLEGISGKQFLSSTHRLIKDRNHLIITPQKKDSTEKYYIDEETKKLTQPIRLLFRKFTSKPNLKIPHSPDIAWIDASILEYPLILRKWKTGDYFYPLGMQDPKKLSDFFIDEKLSLIEKESSWILTSGDKIVWVLGKRIDDRFRIGKQT
ncbi:MAG: tRNA lysidine(34) synthetase TilS, partial [Bacteroidales bacterium]|nr:tRNA lysidine(34) synthetase TilS [Bacteroidales bacterium]